MPVKKAHDTASMSTKLLKILGRMADENLPIRTKKQLMEELSQLLGGKPFTTETFANYGIQARILDGDKNITMFLEVMVPNAYLPAYKQTKEGRPQPVVFDINRVLNI